MKAISAKLFFIIGIAWISLNSSALAIDEESLKTPYLDLKRHYDIRNFGANLDIAVSSKGDVYISSASRSKLWMLDRVTQRFSDIEPRHKSLPLRFFPETIAIDGQDHLWITDKTLHRVQVIDRNGELLQTYENPEQPWVTLAAINYFSDGIAIWDKAERKLWMVVKGKIFSQQLDADALQCVGVSQATAFCLQASGRELVKYQNGTVAVRRIFAMGMYTGITDLEVEIEGNLLILNSEEKKLLSLSSDLEIQYQLDSYQNLLRRPTRLARHEDHIWLIDEGRQELLQFDLRWATTGWEHALLGEEYLSVNLPKPALEELDKAIRLGFRDPQTFLLKGKAQYRLKLYAEAFDSFSQVKEADADTNFWQANTLFQLGQYEKSLTIYNELLATSGIEKSMVRFNIAQTLIALKRFAEAEFIFRQLIQDEPNNAQARLGLGRALMGLHRYADLINQLNSLVSDKAVGREARHSVGLAWMEIGKLEIALPLLERAAQEGPYFKEALRAVATIHRRLGSTERAAHYENQLKIFERQVDQRSTFHLLENE